MAFICNGIIFYSVVLGQDGQKDMNTAPTSAYIKGLIYLISRWPLIFCSIKCPQKVKRANRSQKSKNNKESVNSDD